MCGIAGFVVPLASTREPAESVLAHMTGAIAHRGPDDRGSWVDGEVGVALGHRRLSILDLSPAGHQPMMSPSGQYVIVFNGEIYNHLDLRSQLDTQWRGHSDTETLLAAIEAFGVEEALKRCIGMFAFALWDRQARVLTLARDRMGEKPLYYGWQSKGSNTAFLFGSELKALRGHPAFDGVIDRDAMCLQLRHGYIPAPHSIYRGIRKLLPGHFVQLRSEMMSSRQWPFSRAYWSLADAIDTAQANRFAGNEQDAIAQLDDLLRDAVRRQMLADVPLGAFLSGGVDSSTIVSLMQAQSARPVKTFTIGFSEEGFNEAEYAKAVARHLGTDHSELYVSSQQARDVIPRLPALYDEPFSDPSQIPTLLVSALARRDVTVSLSGDGGDELFGGYYRYFETQRWRAQMDAIPQWVRRCSASVLLGVPRSTWGRIGTYMARLSGNHERWLNMANRGPKLAGVLRSRDISALYLYFLSHWLDPSEIVVGGSEPTTMVTDPPFLLRHPVEQMMAIDTVTYLPDDILVKVDRAAMAVSLETRVPLLDHRVIEFAWRLPHSMKVRDGQGKWILKQVLRKYVPDALIDRPKMGFGVPIDSWLRGPMRDWAESLLSQSRLRNEGFFDPEPIRRKWSEHLTARCNWQYLLWDVLMFQAWLEAQSGQAQTYAPAA